MLRRFRHLAILRVRRSSRYVRGAGHRSGRGVLDRTDQHVAANEQVYAAGDGVERLDHPLVMKVDESHFPVFAADDVPSDTLGLPDGMLEVTRVDTRPTLRDVLVVKAGRVAQLLEWATPYTNNEPDRT